MASILLRWPPGRDCELFMKPTDRRTEDFMLRISVLTDGSAPPLPWRDSRFGLFTRAARFHVQVGISIARILLSLASAPETPTFYLPPPKDCSVGQLED